MIAEVLTFIQKATKEEIETLNELLAQGNSQWVIHPFDEGNPHNCKPGFKWSDIEQACVPNL